MTVAIHDFRESLLDEVKCANISHCWSKIKSDVLKDIGAPDFMAVPYIQDYEYYDLGAVIFKKQRLFRDFFNRRPTDALAVTTIGSIFCKSDRVPTEIMLRLTTSKDIIREPELIPNHFFKVVRPGEDQKKKISLKLCDIYVKRLENHIDTTGVYLDLSEFKNHFSTETLYLVYEVIYATEFILKVIGGESRHIFRPPKPTAFGMKLCRYSVSADSQLQRPFEMPNSVKVRWRAQATYKPRSAFVLDYESRKGPELRSCLLTGLTTTHCHWLPTVKEDDEADSYLPASKGVWDKAIDSD